MGNFGAGGKQEHGPELRANFFNGCLPAQIDSAQFSLAVLPSYRLRCFSFARTKTTEITKMTETTTTNQTATNKGLSAGLAEARKPRK